MTDEPARGACDLSRAWRRRRTRPSGSSHASERAARGPRPRRASCGGLCRGPCTICVIFVRAGGSRSRRRTSGWTSASSARVCATRSSNSSSWMWASSSCTRSASAESTAAGRPPRCLWLAGGQRGLECLFAQLVEPRHRHAQLLDRLGDRAAASDGLQNPNHLEPLRAVGDWDEELEPRSGLNRRLVIAGLTSTAGRSRTAEPEQPINPLCEVWASLLHFREADFERDDRTC